MKHLYALSIFFSVSVAGFGQSTFESVHALFQTKCTTGCHSGGSPSGQLNLSGTTSQVYQTLVNVNPVNPVAAAAGYKRVDPGYPERSFLFLKVSHDIDAGVNHLATPGMGNPMPNNLNTLENKDIELIRQWILWGGGDTNHYIDIQILADYYTGAGMPRIPRLTPPDVSEGFQVHYGPFFLAPATEKEVFYKYATKMPVSKEVNRVNTVINDYSHHTALYKYYPEQDSNFLPGLRPVNTVLDAAGVYYTSTIIGQWPNSQDLLLPEGTAFTWEANSVIDLNYHIPNYNQDSILPAEVYANFYAQSLGTAQTEMIAGPIYYGGDDPTGLTIPGNTTDSVYTITQFDPDSNYTWYIWSIMAHTHKLGEEYNIWMRNNDGTKGEQIYDGHYNVDYTFNQGYYDWATPPFRTFDPMQEVDFSNGLIHECTYTNPTANTVYFGLHTWDEMFVSYIQYTREPVTISIKEESAIFNYLNVYPNPSRDVINLSFNCDNSSEGTILLLDMMGREVYSKNISITEGKQKLQLSQSALGLTPGFYSMTISTNSGNQTAKIIFE